MHEVHYRDLKSIVAERREQGDNLTCLFRCPVTGVTVEGTSDLRGELARPDPKDTVQTVRRGLFGTLFTALGLGKVMRDLGLESPREFTVEEKQAAVVRAFEGVVARFVWDGARWVARDPGALETDFTRQLNQFPVDQDYDRAVLVRMCLEVVRSDGEFAEEEREFLETLMQRQFAAEFPEDASLTLAELAETSLGPVRETMLVLAWALALADESLAESERSRLGFFARALGVDGPRTSQLKEYGQEYLIDQAFGRAYQSGQIEPDVRARILELAAQLELPEDEAVQVEFRYRTRTGMG